MKAARWEIENFFTPDECNTVLTLAEQVGFENTRAGGPITVTQYRNNDRCEFTSELLKKEIWNRIKGDPRLINPGWEAIGLVDNFRVYRYKGIQHFKKHLDGSIENIPGQEETWVTILIYLNDDFMGGETSFEDGDVIPKTGMAALMTQRNVLHEAKPIKGGGTKYVLRTDVMYRKVG